MSGRKNIAAMLSGQVARVVIQGGYFVLLASELGVRNFGLAAATLAMAALLIPFSNCGAALLALKNVSRDPSAAAVQWANTVAMTILSGGTLLIILVTLVTLYGAEKFSPGIVIAVGLADLICARFVDGAAYLFQALGEMGRAAYLYTGLQLARLLGLIVVAGTVGVSVNSWAASYLVSSVPVAWIVAAFATRRAGGLRPQLSHYAAEWKTGALFSVSMSTQAIYNDADKVLLARLATLEATGTYAAAYRIVDMSMVPVRALMQVSLPSMHRAGVGGIQPVLRVVRRELLLPVTLYCALGSCAMFLAAGLLPSVIGQSFSPSVPALQLLSILLFLKGAHYLAADVLMCGGRQALRTSAQVIVAFLNVGLCLWLIPAYSWQGAAAASLISDGSLALMLWVVVMVEVRRGHPDRP